MRRSAQDIFAHPGSSTERALAFISCAGFYAMMGTLFASLIAWSIVLIASAGTIVAPVVAGMLSDEGSLPDAGTAVGLATAFLALVATGAVGYVVAPFVGALIGWKSAIAISLAMGLAWCRSDTRRYALRLSPFIGALGGLLTSPFPFAEHGNGILVSLGITLSAALSTWFVTWIVRYWLQPDDLGISSLAKTGGTPRP